MGHKNIPTTDTEAFSSFVQGRALFNSYLATGRGEELRQARDRFTAATVRDSDFDIARLYLAATQTELRESDAAIPNLGRLIERNRYLPEARIQLAYAHIKQYRDYAKAAEELDKAADAVRNAKKKDLVDLVEAYRVFFLAVRGGRGTRDPVEKKRYLLNAVSAGEQLLTRWRDQKKSSTEKLTIQFEVQNALGIAFMWLGESFPLESDSASRWNNAEANFRIALTLRPKSVRPLQNMGLLRMMQGDRQEGDPVKARDLYEEAKRFVLESLALNSFDQYPHFQMALLSVKTQDWPGATKFVEAGKKEKGTIPPDTWASIEQAIATQDPAKIRTFR